MASLDERFVCKLKDLKRFIIYVGGTLLIVKVRLKAYIAIFWFLSILEWPDRLPLTVWKKLNFRQRAR